MDDICDKRIYITYRSAPNELKCLNHAFLAHDLGILHLLNSLSFHSYDALKSYPFTAPDTIPLMICLLKEKYKITIGDMVNSIADIILG